MTPGELLVQIRVKGMDCSEEVAVVRQALEPLSGVIGLNADVAQGIVTVRISPTGPSPEMMVAAITRGGLGAEVVTAAGRPEQTVWTRRWRDILAAVATAAIIAGASWHAVWGGFSAIFTNTNIPWLTQAWYALAIILSVGPLMPRAWGAVRSLRLDMNVLMVIAVIGAISLGDWFEAAAVSTLFSWSLVLEGWTARRAGRAIADLMKSAPKRARIRATAAAAERDVPVTEVRSGDVVIVRPGETIPIDGRIVSGGSSINQAPITGESVPVVKTVGATVFAGCVNGEGALEIEMTGAAGDTMLACFARMVAE